jgi:hypothetical protein
MQRSAQRRSPAALRNRRVIAVGAVVLVVGGMLAVTQMSDASTRRFGFFGSRSQQQTACPTSSPTRRWNTRTDLATSQDGQVEQHTGDGQASSATLERAARERGRQRTQCTPSTGTSGGASTPASSSSSSPGNVEASEGNTGGGTSSRVAVPPGGADGANNGLQILGRDCTNSQLNLHDGFQNAPACSQTMFGEVPEQAKAPSLLITEHPDRVGVNEAFSFTVSTRNLQRDRFLGAAAGGYYLESSFLNEDQIVRGHFHSDCQLLQSTDEAPPPDRAQFFVATEDGKGGTTPDSVTINVPGLAAAGTYRCASWAGDASHRVPMAQFANQTPAFDTFRLVVE